MKICWGYISREQGKSLTKCTSSWELDCCYSDDNRSARYRDNSDKEEKDVLVLCSLEGIKQSCRSSFSNYWGFGWWRTWRVLQHRTLLEGSMSTSPMRKNREASLVESTWWRRDEVVGENHCCSLLSSDGNKGIKSSQMRSSTFLLLLLKSPQRPRSLEGIWASRSILPSVRPGGASQFCWRKKKWKERVKLTVYVSRCDMKHHCRLQWSRCILESGFCCEQWLLHCSAS